MRHERDVLAPGTRLEEFEIERKLGAGGFGVTYLAYDCSLKRRVAIKEYLPDEWATRRPDGAVGPWSATHAEDYRWGLDRFLKEAQVLARLHHAHIVQVYRVMEAWGTAYMVMEYVEGSSLAEALRAEGPWAEARVLGLLDALTVGLAEVHAAGLVHRDIKPANVMLRGDGSPVLIDFGAARRAVGRQSGSVRTVVGTDGYAPFEQTLSKGVQGPWTDVYALGAVAYEALSGRVPDKSNDRMDDDTLPPVAEVAAHGVSAEFASAIGEALALRRQDRPQSLAAWRGLLGLPAVAGTAPGTSPAPPRIPDPAPGGLPGLRSAGRDGVQDGGPRSASAAVAPVDGAGAAVDRAGPGGASRRWWLVGAAAVVVALTGAGLVWLAGGAAAPETAGTAAGARGGANARPVARGVGGGRRGSGVGAEAASVDPVAARGGAVRNGGRFGAGGNESGSAPADSAADSAVDVAPEAVEETLGLDRAGWRRIQEGLAALGLEPGAPDGLVGGGTRRAVRAYQAGAGKPVTGFLDSTDVTTLRAAASEADRVAARRRAEAEAAEAERRLAELRRPGRVFRDDCDGCPELVVIPAGTFRMGSPASEEGRYDNEGPQHSVTLRSFALGRTEVTRAEYAAFVTATGHGSGGGCTVFDGSQWDTDDDASWREPGFSQGGGHPVVCVNWRDAQAYVAWLSRETGSSYRLPSESEWEYAARSGTTTARHWGAGSADQCGYANGTDAASKRRINWRNAAECDDGMIWTASAGSYAENGFGLLDMLGNAWEWVEDCWHGDYRGAPSDGTAWTRGGDCGRRVLRGGSWGSAPRNLRSALRLGNAAGARDDSIGFRVARTLD